MLDSGLAAERLLMTAAPLGIEQTREREKSTRRRKKKTARRQSDAHNSPGSDVQPSGAVRGATPSASLLQPAGMGTPSLSPPDSPMAPCWHLGMSLHKPESWLDRAKQARRDRASWLASAKYVSGRGMFIIFLIHPICGTCIVWGTVRKCHSNGRTGVQPK